MSKKLEKLKKQHEYRMALLKLKGEQKHETNKILNEITLEGLRGKKNQSGIVSEIRQLKLQVSRDTSTIRMGKLLLLFAFMATLVSTVLTIAGLYHKYDSNLLVLTGFVSWVIITQSAVFIISSQMTTTKNDYRQHLRTAILMRLALVIVSVYGNYLFFSKGLEDGLANIVITLLICIGLDCLSMFCVSIGNDFRTLNKNTSIQKSENIIKVNEFVGRVKKLSRFVPKKGLEISNSNKEGLKEIETNKNVLTFVPKKNTENQHAKIEELKNNKPCAFVLEKDLEIVKNAIFTYKDGNICPSISALYDLTGLTKNKISDVKKELEKQGVIKTDGTTTYVLNEIGEVKNG